MLNRNNWKLYKRYLTYRAEIDQLASESLRAEKNRLRHVLVWADDTPLAQAPSIRPAFPSYLTTARSDRKGLYSQAYAKKVINTTKRFLRWACTHDNSFRKFEEAWLETMRVPRDVAPQGGITYVSAEEIMRIAAVNIVELRDQRIQATACLLYLSGMRVGAFASLPIRAVHLDRNEVHQFPNLGVKTKNGKRAITFLLPIPELLDVVRRWDEFVRSHLPGSAMWFAPIDPKTGHLQNGTHAPGKHRTQRVRADLKRFLAAHDVPRHSPHKFRNGFAVYALSRARDMQTYKAISMNLMHSDISITDGVYATVSENERREAIASLATVDTRPEVDVDGILARLASLEGKIADT